MGDNIINGYKNEFDLIYALNNKKFKDINYIFYELLLVLFPTIKDEDLVYAYKYGRYAKVDMVIEVNNIKKGISIKSGYKNSVHVEKIDVFVKKLEDTTFNLKNELLDYLFSDGTIDNTGINRISISEYKVSHKNEILMINSKLNEKSIKERLIYRFLICSDINYKIKVDAFIYGTSTDFLWATSEEVLDYLINKQYFYSEGVHVSSLYIQEWNKNLVRNPKYEFCREYVQVKWYSLQEDIIRIMCERNN